MQTITPAATRGEKYWLVYVPEIEQYTQAKKLADIEEQARDLTALWLDIPLEDVAVDTVVVNLPEDVENVLNSRNENKKKEEEYAARARNDYRTAARLLRGYNLTYQDIGDALRISRQRAYELATR